MDLVFTWDFLQQKKNWLVGFRKELLILIIPAKSYGIKGYFLS
jgi:hypothetical protein